MNYFDQLEMLDKAIGFGSERNDVLVYAENETMFSIHNRNDLDMRRANAVAGFIPLGQITRIEATKPGEDTKIVCVLHIPLDYPDTDGLRNRMSHAVFSLISNASECAHPDFRSQTIWVVDRKAWQSANLRVPVNVRTKIGRNDPCPCSSGKKWKKCCMGFE